MASIKTVNASISIGFSDASKKRVAEELAGHTRDTESERSSDEDSDDGREAFPALSVTIANEQVGGQD